MSREQARAKKKRQQGRGRWSPKNDGESPFLRDHHATRTEQAYCSSWRTDLGVSSSFKCLVVYRSALSSFSTCSLSWDRSARMAARICDVIHNSRRGTSWCKEPKGRGTGQAKNINGK
jgi:hypothetical protein